ncbi:hypothetical protein DQ04_03951000 [Trypanosoma grayi]|uniref:hypothetical protein n=1 Tax=Trypanosoma grayi TaxID=71804 RepID=UPI0004F4ADB0|nr:hypothetical protein DQ04_03951000 [Trypanosoma grayi]KEG10268.1 hypothetical protein DQ04_03951000 [Trypanosoma grayi]
MLLNICHKRVTDKTYVDKIHVGLDPVVKGRMERLVHVLYRVIAKQNDAPITHTRVTASHWIVCVAEKDARPNVTSFGCRSHGSNIRRADAVEAVFQPSIKEHRDTRKAVADEACHSRSHRHHTAAAATAATTTTTTAPIHRHSPLGESGVWEQPHLLCQ